MVRVRVVTVREATVLGRRRTISGIRLFNDKRTLGGE
jgi:hypothetical protein